MPIPDEEINRKIDDRIAKVVPGYLKTSAFTDRKLTDTPTDDLQVVNKKYCDANAGGGAAGNDTEVKFNDGGEFGADPNLTFDKDPIGDGYGRLTINDFL